MVLHLNRPVVDMVVHSEEGVDTPTVEVAVVTLIAAVVGVVTAVVAVGT